MAGNSDIEKDTRQWFGRMESGGAVYGPVRTQGLQLWTEQGRVLPDDEVSEDKIHWRPAQELPELGMDMLIAHPNGTFIGPFHRNALQVLIQEGKIPPDAEPFPKSELAERLAARQMMLFGDDAQGESRTAGGSTKRRKGGKSAAAREDAEDREDLRPQLAELHDLLDAQKSECANLQARWEESEEARRTAEAARDEAVGRVEELETAKTAAEEALKSAEAGRAAAESARDEAVSRAEELETAKTAAEEALKSAEAAQAAAESALDEAVTRAEALEAAKTAAEEVAKTAEAERAAAESARDEAVSRAEALEAAKTAAEAAEKAAEAAQAAAESARNEAVSRAEALEAAKAAAEEAAKTAEAERAAAESARNEAVSRVEALEAAKTVAEEAAKAAEAGRTAAESARDEVVSRAEALDAEVAKFKAQEQETEDGTASLRWKLMTAESERDELQNELSRQKTECSALQAQLEKVAAEAAEDIRTREEALAAQTTRNEELFAQLQEKSRRCDAAWKKVAAMDEDFAAERDRMESKIAQAKADAAEEAGRELAELLSFSNQRDADYARELADLRAQVAELRAQLETQSAESNGNPT